MIEKYLNGLEIKKDELTAIERMSLFSQGKPIDRIPCCLDTGETMAPLMGISVDKYYHSAELMGELEVNLQEHFPSDGVVVSTTMRGWVEEVAWTIKCVNLILGRV